MAIVPWNSFFDLNPIPDSDDWLPSIISREKNIPAMNLYETDKDLVAEINIPGIDPKKTEVTLDNGMLRIKGEGGEVKEEKKKDYWKKEINHRSFERAIRIPVPVDNKKVEAEYKNGVLKIRMSKLQKSAVKGKKIRIKTE